MVFYSFLLLRLIWNYLETRVLKIQIANSAPLTNSVHKLLKISWIVGKKKTLAVAQKLPKLLKKLLLYKQVARKLLNYYKANLRLLPLYAFRVDIYAFASQYIGDPGL